MQLMCSSCKKRISVADINIFEQPYSYIFQHTKTCNSLQISNMVVQMLNINKSLDKGAIIDMLFEQGIIEEYIQYIPDWCI